MSSDEGLVDYGSGRYKLVGRAGRDDYSFHAGDWLEVWGETRWLAVQVLADLSGRWYFVDACQAGERMASYVSSQNVGERLSRPSKCENGGYDGWSGGP